MTKPLIFTLLLALAATTGGCSMFKKGNRQKESSGIASEVEATFQRRWMDQRLGELTRQGLTPEAARAQAENEFRERYSFSRPSKR